MPVNPIQQRRALFTIQKGPRESDQVGSVTVDGSSIEPADDDLVLNTQERNENDFRRTQIIALLGLDTIASIEGFEDFTNYFKLRNVESEIVQGLVKSHLNAFDQFSSTNSRRRGRRSFNASSVKGNAAWYINNCYDVGMSYTRAFKNLQKFERGVSISNDPNEGINNFMKHEWIRGYSKFTSVHRLRKFFAGKSEEKPESYRDFLNEIGLDMSNERPTLQYLRLALELESQMSPRTGPRTFYENNSRIPISRSFIRGYTAFKPGSQGDLELNGTHLVRPFRPFINNSGGSGHPIWADRSFSEFAYLDDHEFMSSLLYVLDREMQLSCLSPSALDEVHVFANHTRGRSAISPSNPDNITIQSYEHAVDNKGKKILKPAMTTPKSMTIETADRENVSGEKYRIFHLENYGISARGSDGVQRLAPRQIFHKMMGTTSAAKNVGNIIRDKESASSEAIRIIREVGVHKQADICKHLGWFIRKVSDELESMLKLIIKSTPEHFASISDILDGQTDGVDGSGYFDRNRFKSREARGVADEEGIGLGEEELQDIQTDLAEEGVENALRANSLLEELMESSNIPVNERQRTVRRRSSGVGGYVGINENVTASQTRRTDEESLERVKQEIIETHEAIQESLRTFAQAVNIYNPGEAGVIHMGEGGGYADWGWSIHRKNWGMGILTALMKMRNVSGHMKELIASQLFSRFKFGVFSYWTADYEGLTSGSSASAKGLGFSERVVDGSTDNLLQYRVQGVASSNSRTPGSITIQSIINSDDPSLKASSFGYVKGQPDIVPKFRIPTSTDSEWYGEVTSDDLTEKQEEVRGIHRFWAPNDPHSLLNSLDWALGNAPDVVSMDRDDKNKYFGVVMPAATSEEYFEIAWSVIGSYAAQSIQNYCTELRASGAVDESTGLTKTSGVGLDTLLAIWFEVLGMVLDGIPIELTKSKNFHAGSSKDRTILVEDMDLLSNADDPDAQLLGTSMNDIFLAKSSQTFEEVFASADGTDIGRESVINFELNEAIEDMERALREQTGRADYNHDGGYNEILRAANNIESAIARRSDDSSLDSITELTLVIPTRLKMTLPNRAGDFKGLSSVGYIRAIGAALGGYNASSSGVSKFTLTDSDQAYWSRAQFTKESAEDVLVTSQATERYIVACGEYLNSLAMYPPSNLGHDIHKLGDMFIDQHMYPISIASAMVGIIEASKAVTQGAYGKFKSAIDTASRGNLFQNKNMQDRASRNFFFFDHATHDRPTRTLMKMLPVGGKAVAKGAEGSNGMLSNLTCTSEFSMPMKNLVIAYLENYPINDMRESIVASGCAAGLDTKKLSVPKHAPLISMDFLPNIDLEEESPVVDPGPIREFTVVATRDLAGDGDFGQFSAKRYYKHDVFLLPESFLEVDLDNAETQNFIRNVAKQAIWYTIDQHRGEIKKTSWVSQTSAGSDDLAVIALDDMVESEILKYLIAMTSGVLIDQDLMFDRTHGFDPSEINIPGFAASDIDIIKRVEKSMRRPSTGLSASILNKALVTQDVSARKTRSGQPIGQIEDPSYLGKFGAKQSLVINEDAQKLTVNSFKTILDPDTGEEIRIPIKSDAEPWNIRLLSSLSNAAVYKAKSIPSSMFASPLFDYVLIARMKAQDFASETSPVDLISYAVQIATVSSVDNSRRNELPRNGSRSYGNF